MWFPLRGGLSSIAVRSASHILFFCLSSRRRHTRYWRDWSSDVCSSDLGRSIFEMLPGVEENWLDHYKQVARTGQPIRVENYQQDVGRWFDVYFSRVDKDGRFVVTVFNDISKRKRAEAELRASEGRQAFLLKLSDILQRQTAPNEIKTAAMRVLGTHLGVGRAQYHEVDGGGEYYSADGIGFADGLPLLDLKYRIEQFGGFVAEDFEAGRPFRSDDLLTDPRPTAEEREAYGFYRIRAGAGIPLLRGGKLVAILAVHDTRPHPWTDLEMELIRETAERIWVAVEKVRTDIAVRESEERKAFLLTLSDRLRTEADPRAIAATSVGLLADHMRLDRAYVAQVDKSRDLAEIVPEYRRPDLAPVEGVLTLSEFPEAFAQVEAATLALSNTAADQTLSDLDRRGFAALPMGALVLAPAREGARNPGWALLVATGAPPHWAGGQGAVVGGGAERPRTAAEVALVEEVAERTWAAVERAKAEAALRENEAALAADLANTELLRGLAERLVTEENIGTIYDEILSAAVAVAQSDAGTLQIYDPQTKSLEIIASQNFSRTINDYFHHVDASSRTACGIAMNTGQHAFVDFPDEVADLGCRLLVDEGLQSALAMPLTSSRSMAAARPPSRTAASDRSATG